MGNALTLRGVALIGKVDDVAVRPDQAHIEGRGRFDRTVLVAPADPAEGRVDVSDRSRWVTSRSKSPAPMLAPRVQKLRFALTEGDAVTLMKAGALVSSK